MTVLNSNESNLNSTGNSPRLTDFFELLVKSVTVYRNNFWRYLGILSVPFIAFLPLTAIVLMPSFSNFQISGGGIIYSLVVIAFLALLFVLTISSQVGLYIMIRDHDDNLTIRQALGRSGKYFWSYMVVSLAIAVFVSLWSMLLVIPGFIALVYYSMAVWALFYEEYKGVSALQRSRELVKGYWWSVLGRIVAFQICVFLVVLVIELIVGVNEVAFQIWKQVVAPFFSFIFMPVYYLFTCYIFWDLKKIKGDSQIDRNKKGYGLILGAYFLLFIIIIILVALLVITGFSSLLLQAIEV